MLASARQKCLAFAYWYIYKTDDRCTWSISQRWISSTHLCLATSLTTPPSPPPTTNTWVHYYRVARIIHTPMKQNKFLLLQELKCTDSCSWGKERVSLLESYPSLRGVSRSTVNTPTHNKRSTIQTVFFCLLHVSSYR